MSVLQRIKKWLNVRAERRAPGASRAPLGIESLEAREVLSVSTLNLDFGTAHSPVQQDYSDFALLAHNSARGYGWESLRDLRADSGGGTDSLTKDFHYGTSEGTFLIDLANGTYDITLTMGSEHDAQDQISIWAEGTKTAENLSSAASDFLTQTIRVGVTDGRLELRIADEGGTSQFFAVNGLSLRKLTSSGNVPPPNGPVFLSVDDAEVVEGDNGTSQAVFQVRLSQASNETITVDFATANGIATLADRDYEQRIGTLTFTSGVTAQVITVEINGDTKAETDETFTLNLTNAVHATLLDGSAVGTIANDEALSVIAIDQAWLDARGTGSYVLDQAGATYVVNTDFSTPSTAFVVGAADVVLDLNGHKVTFGDNAPVDLINGGFEAGTGTTVPGWDLRYAPDAAIAANTRQLFDDQVLRFSNITSTQRIFSGPIAIPQVGRPYAATITPANPKARVTVQITILDAITGETLATGKSASATRGYSAVAIFTPETTNPVFFVVDVIPKSPGTPTSVDLDMATLTYAGDYGIVAARAWSGAVLGWDTLSAEAKAAYRRSSNFTVKNGFLHQGQGNAYGSSALYFRSLRGFTVDNVDTLVTGIDSINLEATYAKVHATVLNSTLRESVANVSNRMKNNATVRLNNTDATVLVQGNRILGSAQVGIMLGQNNPDHAITVDSNEIRQNGVVTNAYGIVLSAVQNFVISNNTILPTNGRGINVDGYSRDLLANGEIFGNYVEVQEGFNREYPDKLEARALRVRNNVDRKGAHRDLHIHHNTFIARTGDGLAQQAFGARISYVNINGHMDNANIRIEDNLIAAYVTTTDTKYRARALVLDQVDAGINLLFRNNVLQSNDVSLQITHSGGNVSDVTLIDNVLSKWRNSHGRAYTGIQAGYWKRTINNVKIFSTQLENGATSDIKWVGTGQKDLAIGWLLDVKVSDPSGQPRVNAPVTVRDNAGNVVASGTTDADGYLRDLEIVTTIYQQQGTSPNAIHVLDQGPQQVFASQGSQGTSQELNLTEDSEIELII